MAMISNKPFFLDSEKRMDLLIQEMLVKQCYPSATVRRFEKLLSIQMKVRDPSYQHAYHFYALYDPDEEPKVFLLEPFIRPSAAIHMYSNGRLCLYDPAHIAYRKHFSMVREILPMTFKWIAYYEAWLINGKRWLGPETPHGFRLTEAEWTLWDLRRKAA